MAHEDLAREQYVQRSTDRAFGLVFSGALFLVACWPLVYRQPPRWWALALSAAIFIVALARPTLLALPNKLWTRLGVLLNRIVSPIALGLLFFGVLTPLGAVIRWSGKDSLRLKSDSAADSYWIGRTPPGPPPDSMENQF